MTYTYSPHAALENRARVLASARIHGKRSVVAAGRIRRQTVTLRFRPLHRGRYHLTLWELLASHQFKMIGRTSIVIH